MEGKTERRILHPLVRSPIGHTVTTGARSLLHISHVSAGMNALGPHGLFGQVH